ncbi:hypothetical protein AgCh_036748 [Apium graveolens]
MNRHVMNCKNSKHMWETIKVINEGTEEVRENKLEILTSKYEHFKSNLGEGITEVFERYNALFNNLNINGKYYSIREINKKFLLTLPTHLEHRITAIREVRDLSEISLERLYGVLKIYELEQIQQMEVYGKDRVVNTSTALVAEGQQQQQQSQQSERMVQSSKAEENVLVAEYDPPTTNQSGDDFYSLEELEQLEDDSMTQIVKRFSNVRFKRNPKFKYKSNYSKFQKGGSSSSNTSSGGYKTWMVDRSTIRCFNCNELGHFVTECRKPKQVRNNSYDSNQKSNSERAYLANGRSWDDTDSEDEEVGNLALMAIDENTSSSRKEVKFIDAELVYHLGGSLDYASHDNELLSQQIKDLEKEVNELRLVHINQDKLKEQVSFLENRVNCYRQLETILKDKITGLETKVKAYFNSCSKAKEFYSKQALNQISGIGFDYNAAIRELGINSPPHVCAKGKEVPHVLKGIDNPIYKGSIAEPFDETSFIIQEEIRAEDRANEKVVFKPSVSKAPFKVVKATETNSDTHELDNKNAISTMHNLPVGNPSHKACGVPNCMSCAFNLMYAYFNGKHVSSDKTTPRRHVNNRKHDRSKTASPPKARKETFGLSLNRNLLRLFTRSNVQSLRKLRTLKLRMLFCLTKVNSTREDTDPITICQWSVSISPGLNPLDASADSGSDIDSSDESNEDGDLRTPIAPPVTSLRMAKVIFLAGFLKMDAATNELENLRRVLASMKRKRNIENTESEVHVQQQQEDIPRNTNPIGVVPVANHDIDRRIERFLSRPVMPVTNNFNNVPRINGRVPSLETWTDLQPGNITAQAICQLMNLAYNLKDSAGEYCFGDFSPELIKEDRDFDDVYNDTLVTVRPLNTLTLTISCEEPEYNERVANGFCYLATSYMRLYTKSAADYTRVEDQLRNSFTNFYDYALPFENFHPVPEAVNCIKSQIDHNETLRNTFYNLVYAGESVENGKQLKEFLYRSHVSYTGMEMKRQMWKYARVFNNRFMNQLQTKNCAVFTATLAHLCHSIIPARGNQDFRKITKVAELPLNQLRIAKECARIALTVNHGDGRKDTKKSGK